MARTLTTPDPLDTLEEAFDLLQRASAPVWLRYLAGSAPLLVGLLFVLEQLSGLDSASDNPMVAALLLVGLLVWFYRCRQIFAGRLRAILSLKGQRDQTKHEDRRQKTEDSMKTPPLRRLAASTHVVGYTLQGWTLACFEGTKLLAVPLAAVSVLPLAYAITFYRSLTLFAGEGLSARDAAAKAWKSCLVWQRENWFTLAIFNLLGLAVLVNVALTVVIAPMLVKLFTGYESVFTQRGPASLGIQLPIIFALTWLCLDPLLQAVYTVRAFKWEGLRTGEDLLVRLKRLAPLLLFFCCAMGFRLTAGPTLTRDDLNRSIDQTLQSRDYNWRIPPPASEAEKKDWFIDTVDRVVALLQKSWKAISDLWSDLLDWIDRMLRNTMPMADKTRAGAPSVVRSVFYVIGTGIVALALFLLWKFGPRRKMPVPVPAVGSRDVDLNNEALLASDLPEDEWLQMAERHASSGDLRLALRALYLGTLALLNHRGLLTVHACKSNRDYEGELRRRSRDTGLTQVFRTNIRSFEQSWYGFHEVTLDQLQVFRDNLGRLRSHAT
jgi:hypothetical protein